MKLECAKSGISEYGFLRLLSATMIANKQSPILVRDTLQKDLVKYYDDEKYHFLFEDIVKKEDKINQEDSYVDLGDAFQMAYALGLLTMLKGTGKLKSVINIYGGEALKIIAEYPLEQTEMIKSMCIDMIESKKRPNVKVLMKV